MRRSLHDELSHLDKKYVWHPFTQHAEWNADPDIPVIVEGKGFRLKDARGRWYLDGVASLWCNVHGHRVPALDRAVRRQLSKIAHATFLGATNEPAVRLAARLVRLAPRGLTRVFYSDSGSEANEIALKMAFQYWRQADPPEPRRDTFLTLKEGYHGDTLGAVSLGGIDLFHGIFGPLLFRTLKAPAPHAFRHLRGKSEAAWLSASVRAVERVFRRHGGRLAAAHLEPLMEGAGGMLLHPRGFLRAMRRLCDRHGVLLVLDEVATGFGRTGAMFACLREGVSPDLLCLGKNLTGGYLPVAATLATERVFRAFLGAFESGRAFYHGHTFTANPLGCAVALANLDLLTRPGFLAAVRCKARLLSQELKPLSTHPHVAEVRLVGFMGGVELVRDKARSEPYPFGWKMGYRVCAEARRRGVLLRPLGNVVVLMPPLALPERDVRFLARVVRESVEAATTGAS